MRLFDVEVVTVSDSHVVVCLGHHITKFDTFMLDEIPCQAVCCPLWF